MCSVDKMLIKGIRSFSPENDHAIVFPKLLTLIVGRNGAGKTVSEGPRDPTYHGSLFDASHARVPGVVQLRVGRCL